MKSNFSFYCILFFVLLVSVCYGQGSKFAWAKTVNGKGGQGISKICVDKLGNIYSLGGFDSTAEFNTDTGVLKITSNGSADVLIEKRDKDGHFIWVKTYGGGNADFVSGICVDASFNLYIIGTFDLTVDMNPGPDVHKITAVGYSDVYVLKLDSAGNFIRVIQFGGNYTDESKGIICDADANVYTYGWFEGTVDFDPGTGIDNLSSGGNDVFIQKMDSSGKFLWARKLGNHGQNSPWSAALDINFNLYVTGEFQDTADFDPGPNSFVKSSNGKYDIFIEKFDSAGNFIWMDQIGGSQNDQSFAISIDKAQNLYIAGGFMDKVDFDPGKGTFYLNSGYIYAGFAFLLKLDSAGKFKWAKTNSSQTNQNTPPNANCYYWSIANDSQCNLHSTGTFVGSMDFDPSNGWDVLKSKLNDIIFQKLDSSGKLIYAKQIGGNGRDDGGSLALNDKAEIYLVGVYNDTVDIDPGAGVNNIVSSSPGDGFILKMTPCKSSDTTFNLSVCDTLIWRNNLYTSSGTYTQLYTSQSGCDSIVKINLTVYKTHANLFLDACRTLNLNGYTYTKPGMYFQKLKSYLGCDSTIRLNLYISNFTFDTSITRNGLTFTAIDTGVFYQWIDCSNGNSPIKGATKKVFTATANGSYALVLSKGPCSDTSSCIIVNTITRIDDIPDNAGYSISPNPSTGKFIITSNNQDKNLNFEVRDLQGKSIIGKTPMNSNNQEFELNGPVGMYLLFVYSRDGLSVIKLNKI